MSSPYLSASSLPPRSKSRYSSALALCFAGVVLLHCSSDDSEPNDSTSGLGDGDNLPSEKNELSLGGLGGSGSGSSRGLHSLCGAGICIPDDPKSCDDSNIGEPDPPVMGGAGGVSGLELGGAAGGVSFDPGDLAPSGAACRVTIPSDCDEAFCDVERICEASGASLEGEPCIAAQDCRAGLACVGEGTSGVCRPFCCEGTAASCSDGTFCDSRQLPESPGVYVPVCVPTEECSLTEIFPCPDDQECSCQGDRACVVVRPDGATACALPGGRELGDSCTGTEGVECAHGFVCSPSAGCMKLCSTVAEESECPEGGTCQSPSEFPSDLGVCVGISTGLPVAR